MNVRKRYTLSSNEDRGAFLRRLQEHFAVEVTSLGTHTRLYYDTFDWHLFKHSLVLYQMDDMVSLWSLDHRPVGERIPLAAFPPFLTDWPDGVLTERLASLVPIRALMERAVVYASYVALSAQEAPHRPVMNVVFEESARKDQGQLVPFPPQIEVTPYMDSPLARELCTWLDALSLTPVSSTGPLATLRTVQHKSAYSAKLAFAFDPDMRAESAVRTILAFLLGIVRQNRAGILHDIDTEFLHDFRVAIRRARSLLGQLPDVLPVRFAKRLRKDLAFLGSLTNHLRDLDVFLLQQADYLAALPPEMRPAIAPLFRAVRYERFATHHRLVEALHTKKCATILQRWEAAATDTKAKGPQARRHLAKVARKRIRTQCRQVVSRTQPDALKNSDPQQLHRLRIECKKLRYLFEFFASVFPKHTTAEAIRRLRHLQDVLGQLHDLEVQQQMLRQFANLVAGAPNQVCRTDRAVESLIRVFEEREDTLRTRVYDLFTDFRAAVTSWS